MYSIEQIKKNYHDGFIYYNKYYYESYVNFFFLLTFDNELKFFIPKFIHSNNNNVIETNKDFFIEALKLCYNYFINDNNFNNEFLLFFKNKCNLIKIFNNKEKLKYKKKNTYYYIYFKKKSRDNINQTNISFDYYHFKNKNLFITKKQLILNNLYLLNEFFNLYFLIDNAVEKYKIMIYSINKNYFDYQVIKKKEIEKIIKNNFTYNKRKIIFDEINNLF
jgi:hypothetical protein